MSQSGEVLVFVEDPGAAVFVADLPAATTQRVQLVAVQPALAFLRTRGVRVREVDPAAAAALVSRERPDVLVVGTSENPNTPAFGMIAAARAVEIPTVGVIDALTNAEHRFRGVTTDPLAHAPDWLAVPDQRTHDAWATLGFNPDRIRNVGHPQYDSVARLAHSFASEGIAAVRARTLPFEAAGRPVVVFAAEVSTGLNPQQYQRSAQYTLQGSSKSRGRTEIVLDEFLRAVTSLDARPFLVLRLHPKNERNEFEAYIDRFDLVSSGASVLDLAFAADLVVGMTSILLAEAAIMGVPTLSIVPRPEEADWLPSIGWGLTPCATERATLAPLLRASLSETRRRPPPPIDEVDTSLQRLTTLLQEVMSNRSTQHAPGFRQ